MVEKAVTETFTALFALIDLRQIFRETKPAYEFNSEQRERIQAVLKQVRKSLDIIEKELT